MSRAIGTFLWGLLLIAIPAVAQTTRQLETIRFTRDEDVLFLNAADLAKSLDLELKIIDSKRLVTFCRDQDGGFCLPIRLVSDNHRYEGEHLLFAINAVQQALRFRAVEADGRITITVDSQTPDDDPALVSGYNVQWGAGRGFAPGETLPDIPLVDVEGNEVRFSQFLGKRYILYCWASW